MSHVCPLNSQPCGCDPSADPKARTYPCMHAKRLGTFVRMMASDKPGEARNASTVFLRDAGGPQSKELLDLVAELIELRGLGQRLYSEKDITEVRDLAKEVGRAEAEVAGGSQYFDADGEPIWLSIASFVQQHCDDPRLNRDFFREFASGIFDKVAHREPSPKQKKWLLVIFMKLGESCAADVQTRYVRNI